MTLIMADMWAPTEGTAVAKLAALVIAYVALVYGGPIWIFRAKSARRYWIRVMVGITCVSVSAYSIYILRAAWGPFRIFFGIVPTTLSAIAIVVSIVRLVAVENKREIQDDVDTKQA